MTMVMMMTMMMNRHQTEFEKGLVVSPALSTHTMSDFPLTAQLNRHNH